jgi:N-acetylglucosamine-6-phosphate deacetylase
MLEPARWSEFEEGVLLEGALLVRGGREPERGDVLLRGTRIAAVGPRASRLARSLGARAIGLDGHYLAAGFIDLHTHGANGVDFVRAGREEFARAMGHYLEHGVTSLLASVYPTSWGEALEVLERLSGFIEDGVGGGVAAGIHLEGPFLNPARPGALPARHFRPCSIADANRLLAAARGSIKTMTIAPELPGARRLIAHLRRRGVVPAFGHSDADYETTRRALAGGMAYVTHLFNAMRCMHHRAPGPVAAILEAPDVAVEVISDGFHVEVPMLRLVNRLKPRSRVVLVSDSVHPSGLRDGKYRFAGAEVWLREGRITLADGTLAGSALALDRALALQVERAGTPLGDAVLYATANPAAIIGLERRRGDIAPGRRADLVLLDRKLRVAATWLAGKLVYVYARR